MKELFPEPNIKPRYDSHVTTKFGTFQIQNQPSGWVADIMHNQIRLFNEALNQHSKVLVVRFDAHLSFYEATNQKISRLLQKLRAWCFSHYPKLREVRYLWVRETEKAKHQHYHVVLLINGNLVKHPQLIFEATDRIWGTRVHRAKFHLITRTDFQRLSNAFHHVSYLAKARGKGYKPQHTKNFGASRMRSGKRAPKGRASE
jgi:hypothetical protein